MTALAADKARMRYGTPIALGRRGVATATTIYNGSLTMVNAAGFLVPGATATGQFVRGVSTAKVVNAGANGAVECPVEEGDFEFESGTAGDAITVANIGDTAWIIDDNTVGATNGGATRSEAGKIIDISPNGKPIVRVIFTGV